jgi:hypothetical protein
MHENVDSDLGIVQAISLGRALIGRGEKGGLRSYQLRGVPETLPNGDAVLVPDERANQRILENLRNDSPKSPRQSPRQERAPRDDDSASGC